MIKLSWPCVNPVFSLPIYKGNLKIKPHFSSITPKKSYIYTVYLKMAAYQSSIMSHSAADWTCLTPQKWSILCVNVCLYLSNAAVIFLLSLQFLISSVPHTLRTTVKTTKHWTPKNERTKSYFGVQDYKQLNHSVRHLVLLCLKHFWLDHMFTHVAGTCFHTSYPSWCKYLVWELNLLPLVNNIRCSIVAPPGSFMLLCKGNKSEK